MNQIHGYLKKTTVVFFAGFLAAAIFFSGASQKGMMSVAEASFLDTIIALVTINPLHVVISAPAEVEAEKVFKVEATVSNRGEERIKNAQAEIFLPEGLVLMSKNLSKEIGVIPGKKAKKAFWRIQGIETGNFVISVSASGELQGDSISVQGNTVIVAVQAEFRPPGRSFNLFQRFLGLFQTWFGFK